MELLVEMKNVTKIYKVNKKHEGSFSVLKNLVSPTVNKIIAIDNVNININSGETIGFIGPNGAGKSTTIKMLTGILVPTEGEISVLGRIPYKNRQWLSSRTGVVFGQKSQLWWDVPVIESFRLLKEIYNIDDTSFKKNLSLYSDLLNIGAFLQTPVRQLSLGQKMRCDLVASLLHDPTFLLLDEPTIGLDVGTKDKLRSFIKEINCERGVTIFLTTHDMKDVEELCKRIILIDKGKKVFDGNLDTLKGKYISNRMLRVKFAKDVQVNDLYILSFVKNDIVEVKQINETYEFVFDYKKISVSEIVEEIQKHFQLTDFSTSEPNIEDVVKQFC